MTSGSGLVVGYSFVLSTVKTDRVMAVNGMVGFRQETDQIPKLCSVIG
jgi:hypothetical protein